ncbi:MAG: hypothetical protein ABIK65_13545 [Candidatus Eisenbacteria bacterium]
MFDRTGMKGISFVPLLAALFASPAFGDGQYENTYAKDFIADAPWRVTDEATPIPVTVVLKDCDVDDIRELHWIRCTDATGGGGPVVLFHHDFGDERLGDDPPEHNFWTYVTNVTEGHPSLPDGTPLAPANLGYGPGDAIQLKVEIYYRDDIFNYTDGRTLRVHVGHGPFPWPEGWYGGDTHYHTMYTNDLYEFGAPLPAVRFSAAALGLHWLTVTDHSCDLDERGDGAYSYGTDQWEATIRTSGGAYTIVRDVNDHGGSWGAIGADAAEWSGPDLRIYRGVEINLASVDGDSYDKTLHGLFYNPSEIPSPLSGAPGERPVTPSLTAGLDALSGGGFAYAAHPLSDLSADFGGIDFGVNGARWGDEDFAAALLREGFRGLEAFNTRITRESNDENDPWGDFDAGSAPGDPYPNELLAGISLWDQMLANDLAAHPGAPRKVFLSGGSDAHGDFNYASHLGLNDYADDNAMGKVQTVVRVPGYGTDSLPPVEEILSAFRAGRSTVTDGPFLEIAVDRNDDGDWNGAGDLGHGDHGYAAPGVYLPLRVRWASLPEFGPVTDVRLVRGDPLGGAATLHQFDPAAGGEGYGGEATIDLGAFGFEGDRFFRAELVTDDGGAGHRAYTNPVWITFDASTETVSASSPPPTPPLRLAAAPNPFNPALTIAFSLPTPGGVRLEAFSVGGRKVRTLIDGEFRDGGRGEIVWQGTGDDGRPLPSGVYYLRMEGAGRTATEKVLLLR